MQNRPILSLYKTISMAAIAAFIAATPAIAQHSNPAKTCSVYFQARANWLKGLDGKAETAAMMARYAEILWASVPQDFGMQTGRSPAIDKSHPDADAVMQLMMSWAESGQSNWPLPVCMEDAECSLCTQHLKIVVRQNSQE